MISLRLDSRLGPSSNSIQLSNNFLGGILTRGDVNNTCHTTQHLTVTETKRDGALVRGYQKRN